MARLEIVVPRNFNDGTPVSSAAFDALDQFFAEEFGGYSRREISGGWKDPQTGQIMKDQSFEYIVNSPLINKRIINELATTIKSYWEQNAVYFTLDGQSKIV